MDIQMRIIVSPLAGLGGGGGHIVAALLLIKRATVLELSNHHKARHQPLIIHGLLVGETCQQCTFH